MLIRRSCWAELGGFDESFFLYYEDADFCRRAWDADWSVWYEPSIRLTHFRPLHTRPVPPELRLMTRHALLTYAEKYWGRGRRKTLASVIWLEALARRVKAYASRNPCVLHAELGRLARDWFGGRSLRARWRIRRAARLLANCPGREDLNMTELTPLRVGGVKRVRLRCFPSSSPRTIDPTSCACAWKACKFTLRRRVGIAVTRMWTIAPRSFRAAQSRT